MRGTSATRIVIAAVLVAAVSAVWSPAMAQPASGADFEDAVQTFNRDVYFLAHSTLRNPTADTPPEAQLYSEVGAALPFTWGQWRAATAESVVTVVGDPQSPSTHARIRLTGLVPNGVYSVFYGTLGPDSEHPGCPGVERTLPLPGVSAGRPVPRPASFVADSAGTAVYVGRVEGDLLVARELFLSIVYHFDGMTYLPVPEPRAVLHPWR